MKNAVLLLSGGLDSSTVLAIAKSEGYNLFALSVCYGQKNMVELNAAKRVAEFFKVNDHKIVELDLRLFGGSSLTSQMKVLEHHENHQEEIPSTYVPARNTIMLSLALAYAEVKDCSHIFFGANVHDYSGYPDCRPQYIEAFEKMANLSTKRAAEGQPVKIHAPLVNLTKKEIIKRGNALGLDYGLTHSCYDPIGDLACKKCSACFYRAKGFSDAGLSDPTRYA